MLLVILFFSCEKSTDWTLQAPVDTYLVVDGTITNEKKQHRIRLSYTVEQLNEVPKMVSGASVIISNSDSAWILTESTEEEGVYLTQSNFSAIVGVEYTLQISIKDSVYTAKSISRAVSPLTFLQYDIASVTPKLFRITWVASAFNVLNPSLYEIFLDWSQVSGYENSPPESCKARLLYFSLQTIDVNQVFAPEMERILFPPGTKIIEKKYSLSYEHAAFYRALLSETNWKGGYFDCASANIPTNLSEGAIGFFGVCEVVSDSLQAE